MQRVLRAAYVLPLKSAAPATDLDEHLARIAPELEVLVVDGSPPEAYADNERRWARLGVRHLPVDDDLVTPMGKVGGVLTGLRHASHDVVVIADDDVRWTPAQLRDAVARIDAGAGVVRPQNRFAPARWHTWWDTGRVLLARATGGDWPGTLVVDRRFLASAGGYDGAALFENLELVRTVQAAGGYEELALDLIVDREPPTTGHFTGQRVRQAYDEWARPGRMAVELAILPLLAVGRTRALVGVVGASIVLAEVGRRRAGGRVAFPFAASLAAPLWVGERAATSWLAVGSRILGGARYGDGRLVLAATRPADLRRRLRR